MSATNSSKESCGKKTKCAVSSNRYDMESSMGGNREAAGGGTVKEENHQVVNANANIIIRKRKDSEYSTLSKQEKASKSKRKKERCQGEDEMANKDARKKRKTSDSHLAVPAGTDDSDLIHDETNMDDGIDMHTTNANDIKAHAAGHEDHDEIDFQTDHHHHHNGNDQYNQHHHQHQHHMDDDRSQQSESNDHHCIDEEDEEPETIYSPTHETQIFDQFALPSQVAENQILRQNCAQARIVINDVISPVQVATGEEKVAADLTNDMTKAKSYDEKWNILFMELVKYKEKNGHCNIPQRNGTLGTWISYQRKLFRSKKLKADRHEKLDGIGFAFEDQKFAIDNERWNTRFVELVEYKEKNGHCNEPISNGTLGTWISTQRTLFTSKKLKEDRYEKLVGIGFTFEDATFAIDEKWNTRFMELVEYKKKNGHCNIPIKKNGSLGIWISDQRKLFKSKKLKADRYEKLVGIGFEFEAALEFKEKLDQQWQEMYQKLLKNKEMKGHCFNVPRTLPLGRWLSWQRRLYRNGKLREDRAEKLLSVGFERWNTRFMELVEYKKKNGHCNIPIKKNGSLGIWISDQRKLFNSKKLKADRYEKLVWIGFEFEAALEFKETLDQQWQEMYQKLLKNKEMKGHCFNVPRTLPLGRWLSWQRRLYRNGKLREDRAEKLLSVGFYDKKV